MSFPFRHQPVKAIYTIGQAVYLMVTLPATLILYALPAARPRRSWPMKRVILGRIARAWIDTTWKTSLDPPPPLPQSERDANSLGFVWVEPTPELVVGEIAEIAKQNEVEPERVGGFWYGPRDSNDRVGQRASPGEKVVYHLHGGGHVTGTAHPKGGFMPIHQGYLDHLGANFRVFSLEYRLSSAAPFKSANPFPASLIDTIAGYRYLVEDLAFEPHHIIISGDSAGGGIAFNLARYIATANLPSLPTPGGLILLSPAMDWAQTHVGAESSTMRNARDCIVGYVFECGYARRALVGNLPEELAATSAWISPGALNAEWHPGMFSGFPRTIMVAGGIECNLDAMRQARDRLVQDNGKERVTYMEFPDALHDFLLFGESHDPERTNTLHALVAWVQTFLDQNSAFSIKAHGTGFRYASSTSSNDIGVSTSDDLAYTVDITLGGQNFTVLLDTGSTDLWVNTAHRALRLTDSSSFVTGIGYGSGQIKGNIDFAELKIGDFVISSQAFLNHTSIKDFSLNGVDGIMGMAFDVASIYSTVQDAWGTTAAEKLARAPITALFAQNSSLPNNFDVQLGRTSELDDIAEGTFQISNHAAGFEAVTKAPQLPRVSAEHWSIVMDSMKINGKAFAFNKSRISGTPSGKIVAALDTGFSFPPLPAAAVDAIYGSIPGAKFDRNGDIWIVPCTGATNLSFVFGGQEFPVHPLDLTWPFVFQMPMRNNKATNVTTCINTYQYLTLDPNSFVGFDVILGDAFLRNVYASFDYGDDYPGNHRTGTPFVQMLSTTNASTMWQEFTRERKATLAKLPPEVDPATVVAYDTQQASASASQNSGTNDFAVSGASSSESGSSSDSWSDKYGMVALGLLAGNLLVGVILLALTLAMCVCGMKGKSSGRYTPVRLQEGARDFESGRVGKYSD